jgi:hypothetical protein
VLVAFDAYLLREQMSMIASDAWSTMEKPHGALPTQTLIDLLHAHLDAQSQKPFSSSVPISISLDDHVPHNELQNEDDDDDATGLQLGGSWDAGVRNMVDSPKSPVRTSLQNFNNVGSPAYLSINMLKTIPRVEVVQSKIDHVTESVNMLLHAVNRVCDGEEIHIKALSGLNKNGKRKVKRGSIGGRTMMICNIPCRIRDMDLIDAIESFGFGGRFKNLSIPYRFGRSGSNLGYAFVDFFNVADAESFALAFEGYRFSQKMSTKACTVKVAARQGRNGLDGHMAGKSPLARMSL